MREIKNSALLQRLYKQVGLADCFHARPRDMRLWEFESGEFVSQPLKPLSSFLFPVQGSIKIYGIRQDSSVVNIHMAERCTLVGDMEFCGHSPFPFFVEATETVLCIAIPFEVNRTELEGDVRFLRFLVDQLAAKLEFSAKSDLIAQTLEEKVICYLEDQPGHTLCGINRALVMLHCSRRQLQRVLKKLCDHGKIEKIGRGCYRKR